MDRRWRSDEDTLNDGGTVREAKKAQDVGCVCAQSRQVVLGNRFEGSDGHRAGR